MPNRVSESSKGYDQMLQGSLENFSLDEVLGLLSGTHKTGKLEIKGDRGMGGLFFSEGALVGASANNTPNGDTTEDIMFELLRYNSGSFSFSSEEVSPMEDAQEMSTVLANADHRLADWREIEAVVPSLAHIVTPVPELPTDEVTIDRTEWAALNVIAAGCPVSLVCDELNLGEVEGSRQIKQLAERSLVLIGDPLSSSSSARPVSGGAALVRRGGEDEEQEQDSVSENLAAVMGGGRSESESVPPSLAGIDFEDDFEAESEGAGILGRYLPED